MMKKRESTGFIYQQLPADVLEDAEIPESPHNIKEFISNALPISDSRYVSEDLRKTNVSIELEPKLTKKVKRRLKKTELSQKERRALGIYRLPKVGIKYKQALSMNKLWEGYMVKFLNLNQLKEKKWYNPKNGNLWESVSISLLKADYHGALIKVINSTCPAFVGHEGIVIFDTKFTFTIVEKDDVTRTIPKLSCMFEVLWKRYRFVIYGKYFCIRTAERSTKKIKSSFVPSL